MSPEDVLDLIREEVKYNPEYLSNSFASLYEEDDLINDIYLKIYDSKKPPKDQETVLECIRKQEKTLNVSRYRNKRNPILFAEELLNNLEKEHSNHELEAIMIKESAYRLSQIIDINLL